LLLSVVLVGWLAGPVRSGAPAKPADSPAYLARVDAIWQRARKDTARPAAQLAARTTPVGRVQNAVLTRGRKDVREIALTFDDGPHPEFTPQLLRVLKQEHVPATFFVVGTMALRSPDLIRAIAADGHTVANHTFHHVNLTKLSVPDLFAEFEANQDAIESITGARPRFFRPPGGNYNDTVLAAAQREGLTTMLWTENPHDYTNPPAKLIEDHIFGRAANGSVILLHDGVQQTVDLLPKLIRTLKAKGYKFVTADQMWDRLSPRVQPAVHRPPSRKPAR